MKVVKIPGLLIISVTVFIVSCLEELDEIDKIAQYTWNPKLAVPLANSRLGFDDFLLESDSTSIVDVGTDGLITLAYEENLVSQTAETIFSVPSHTINTSVPVPPGPISGQLNVSQSFVVTYPTAGAGEQLDSVFLKGGTLQTDIDWNFSQAGNFTITLDALTSNGTPLNQNYNFNGTPGDRQFANSNDLAGVVMDLTDNGTATNAFRITVDLNIIDDGNPIGAGEQFNISFQVQGPLFQAIFGNLGSNVPITSEMDTINIKFFDNVQTGAINIEDPKAQFTFENELGLPIAVNMANNLVATSVLPGPPLTLTGPTPAPVINAPDLNNFGGSVTSNIEVNQSNSNIPAIVSSLPNRVVYQLDGIMNPSGPVSNFVVDTSKVNIGMRLELPLFGSISNLEAFNDFAFEGEDLEDLDFAFIQVLVSNELPFEADIQVEFLDAGGNLLAELVEGDPTIVPAAVIDGAGNVTAPGEESRLVEITQTKIDAIKNARTIRVRASVTTSNNGTQSVRVLDSYQIVIFIGIQTQFEFTAG